MDKVKSCYERIRVIRGVSYGFISYEQIQDLFDIFQLDNGQQQSVMEMLENEGCCPVREDEIPKRPFNEDSAPKNTDRLELETDAIVESNEQASKMRRQSYREEMLQSYLQAVKDNPALVNQYQIEENIFRNAIIEHNALHNKSVFKCISKAAMNISSYRVREINKNGWVCGTYMSHMRDNFERWLQCIFSEDELCEFISFCEKDNELDSQYREVLLLILHNIPKTLVHRYNFKFE